MKLLNVIVSSAVISLAVPLISSAPAVASCHPYAAAGNYGDMLKSGTSPGKAMGVVKREYYDGTEDCRIKFNSQFYKRHGIKPFNSVLHTPANMPAKVAFKAMSDEKPCWNRIIAHFPAGDVKKCI
jgi:hypothetical protein